MEENVEQGFSHGCGLVPDFGGESCAQVGQGLLCLALGLLCLFICAGCRQGGLFRQGFDESSPGDGGGFVDGGAVIVVDADLEVDAQVDAGLEGDPDPVGEVDAQVDAGLEGDSDPVGVPCEGQCGPYRSCLDILMRNPSARDGWYEINPRGADGGSPFTVECDMTTAGGGWTLVHRADFNDGDPSGWIDGNGEVAPVHTTGACAETYTPFLGLFGEENLPASQVFDLRSVPHNELSLKFSYIFIDTIDRGDGARVFVDGTEIWRHTIVNRDEEVNCWIMREGPAGGAPIEVSRQVSHAANSLTLTLGSTILENIDNESYGINFVVLKIR